MKFSWAIKAIENGKSVNRKADKTTMFVRGSKKGEVNRHYKNGSIKGARFTADAIFASDWYEVK